MRGLFAAWGIVLGLSAPGWASAVDPGVVEQAEASERKDADDPLALLPAANPIGFKAVLEKAEVRLADPFRLTIEVRHDPLETYALPDKLDLKEFGVRERSSETRGEEPRITTIHLVLQAFDIGEREIPPIRLHVDSPGGARQLEVPAQKLVVEGIIDLTQGEPRMREDNRPLPTREVPVWWPFAIPAALLLALAGWLLWKRWKAKQEEVVATKPRPPADVEALERLAQLEAEALPAKDRRQEHFFRVSEIVRDYVGRRFGFDALELTTDELVQAVNRRPTPGLEVDVLGVFLRQSDLVKFARHTPTDGECKAALEVARRLVERSRPPSTEEGRAA